MGVIVGNPSLSVLAGHTFIPRQDLQTIKYLYLIFPLKLTNPRISGDSSIWFLPFKSHIKNLS